MINSARRFLRCTGVAFLARLQYEFLKALVAPVSDHIPWRHIPKHWVWRPKPQGSLDRVAVEKLRYQIANAGNLLQMVLQFLGDAIVQPNGFAADSPELGQFVLVELQESGYTGIVEGAMVGPEIERVGFRDSAVQG